MAALGVRQRLVEASRQHLSEHGLQLSLSGRIYLEVLLARAAQRIASEGKAEDAAAIELAERRVRQLLDTAAGTGVPAESPEALA